MPYLLMLSKTTSRFLGLSLLMFLWSTSLAGAADVTVECLNSGNCSDLSYSNHDGTVTAVCDSEASGNLPVKINLNGAVYAGNLSCEPSGGSVTGPWTVIGPGACSQECGGGTQFFTVTCEFDTCTGERPSDSQACNTQACANCNPDNWSGDRADNICQGQTGVQTNECGDDRVVSGTWEPQDWAPHESLVCSFDDFYQRTSCGGLQEAKGILDCAPTWHWLRPAEPEPLVSTNEDSDYTTLRVSGDLFYSLAGRGFFEVNQVRSARVVLSNGDQEYEYTIPLASITFTERTYDFLLDIALLESQRPVGQSSSVNIDDGVWQLDVMFEHRHDGMNEYDWVRSGIGGKLMVDSTPPNVDYTHRKTANSGAEEFGATEITNEPGYVWLTCLDIGPAGCLGDISDRNADSTTDDHVPFLVSGNFCADSARCDDDGVRTFELCDRVDNCTNLEVELDHYDPIPPSALEFVMQLEVAGRVIGSTLKASPDYYPNLEYVDPGLVSISTNPSVIGRQAYILSEKFEQIFDEHACGDPARAPFVLNSSAEMCELQNPNYRPTCEDLNSCPDPCPANYVWDVSLNRCKLMEVTPITLLTESAPVAYTGSWGTTPAPACSADCGQSSGVVYGAVDCSNDDCDPDTRPEVPLGNCPATAVCAPTYTGTWVAGSAPACPAACGQPASTQTGVVTCSNDNCDPAAQPVAKTNSCSPTAACRSNANATPPSSETSVPRVRPEEGEGSINNSSNLELR